MYTDWFREVPLEDNFVTANVDRFVELSEVIHKKFGKQRLSNKNYFYPRSEPLYRNLVSRDVQKIKEAMSSRPELGSSLGGGMLSSSEESYYFPEIILTSPNIELYLRSACTYSAITTEAFRPRFFIDMTGRPSVVTTEFRRLFPCIAPTLHIKKYGYDIWDKNDIPWSYIPLLKNYIAIKRNITESPEFPTLVEEYIEGVGKASYADIAYRYAMLSSRSGHLAFGRGLLLRIWYNFCSGNVKSTLSLGTNTENNIPSGPPVHYTLDWRSTLEEIDEFFRELHERTEKIYEPTEDSKGPKPINTIIV